MNRKDMDHLRLLPLNLVASIKLRAAGQTEYPDSLPVFQLMAWGLADGIPLTHSRTEHELARLSKLEDQQYAVNYLVEGVPGGLSELHRNLLKFPPRAAAHLLLDILDMRLKAAPRNPYPVEPSEA
ncbi:MAG TPA: hypothetical protein PLI53_12495 [Geobacteraceae bacterium]|nr:hypothetical protein [Geobacteraceae bacterium]